MPFVVNLYAGPGAGKSTVAAGVFNRLKWKGIHCELVAEYAKEKVWDNSLEVLEDQVYVFAKQQRAMRRLEGKVDAIVTDSPLLLSLVYGKRMGESFTKLVLETHNRYENLNFFLHRCKPYVAAGRLQTYPEALTKDGEILAILQDNNIEFESVTAIQGVEDQIAAKVIGTAPALEFWGHRSTLVQNVT